MKKDEIGRFSLVSRSAKYQIGIAMALITVIPLLFIMHMVSAESGSLQSFIVKHPATVMLVTLVVLCGYSLVGRYPVNIMRLRMYLEDMVHGKLPDKVELLRGMDDIPAIERSMNMIVEQMSGQVDRMEDELRRIEWLLNRTATPSFWGDAGDSDSGTRFPEKDLASGSPILSSVGKDMLANIVGDVLDLLETAAVVTEADGREVFCARVSEWCRLLAKGSSGVESAMGAAVPLGRGVSWSHIVRLAMEQGRPIDLECDNGIQAYCAPIQSGDRILGSIGFSYGDPPRDPEKLAALAARFGVEVEALTQAAEAYETRPQFIVSVAKNRLLTSCKLIAEIFERKTNERTLERSEAELREHRTNLEKLVEDRTAELTNANEHLQREIRQREAAERLKDEFVSTVSHELRTPLAITKEGVGLLLDRLAGDITEKQEKILKTASGNIDRLARIINDLLDISKIEAGKMRLDRGRVDLRETVDTVVESIRPLAEHKGLELKTDMPEDPLDVYVDRDRLIQVLNNLVGNALKFTQKGSVVVTVGSGPNGMVECAIEDTGVGIAPEDVKRVFDKFTQFGRVHGAGLKGTGLGLAISKNIVELHGGHIEARSEIDKGTTFTFVLPEYSSETVMHASIAERLRDRKQENARFLLLLADIWPPSSAGTQLREALAANGNLDELKSTLYIRSTDLLLARTDSQAVVFAQVGSADLPVLKRRWTESMGTWTNSLVEGKGTVVFGEALYPEDGETAEALLISAEKSAHKKRQAARGAG